MDALKLPQLEEIRRLGSLVSIYPASQRDIMQCAQRNKFSQEVIGLLREFPTDEVFESPTDLTNRCDTLEIFIQDEHDAPKEYLRSSID